MLEQALERLAAHIADKRLHEVLRLEGVAAVRDVDLRHLRLGPRLTPVRRLLLLVLLRDDRLSVRADCTSSPTLAMMAAMSSIEAWRETRVDRGALPTLTRYSRA